MWVWKACFTECNNVRKDKAPCALNNGTHTISNPKMGVFVCVCVGGGGGDTVVDEIMFHIKLGTGEAFFSY